MSVEIVIMGCDIHMFREELIDSKWTIEGEIHYDIEDPDEEPWMYLKEARIPIGRNYVLFGLLAQVRNDLLRQYSFEPRGIPDDINLKLATIYGQEKADAHTASYLDKEELEETYKQLTIDALLKSTTEDAAYVKSDLKKILNAFPKTNNDHRIVFWFDN